jgi:uncharacterized protein (DUF1697 family)
MKRAALLRGINVGGHAILPMKDLVAIFEKLGCLDVCSYIQSGNVVFDAPAALAKRVPAAVTAAIAKKYRVSPAVLLRDYDELAAIARGNPFANAEPNRLHVAFLSDAPAKAAIAALDPARSPGDTFEVRGREIYLHLPNGAGKTKLSNTWFESKLGTVSTWRNWNTLQKLVELTAG